MRCTYVVIGAIASERSRSIIVDSGAIEFCSPCGTPCGPMTFAGALLLTFNVAILFAIPLFGDSPYARD